MGFAFVAGEAVAYYDHRAAGFGFHRRALDFAGEFAVWALDFDLDVFCGEGLVA